LEQTAVRRTYFFNDQRLHEALGDLPAAEYEELTIENDNTAKVSTT
jgi:hypothetical protein